jgi:hypothetical protein
MSSLGPQTEATQLPTLTALLSVVRLFLRMNIYLFLGVEMFRAHTDCVTKRLR